MFGRKIKVSDELYEKLKKVAEKKGYSSVDEFVTHVLEKAALEADDSLSEEQVKERLKGLGYVE
jgi:predicted CopG family antitoxin